MYSGFPIQALRLLLISYLSFHVSAEHNKIFLYQKYLFSMQSYFLEVLSYITPPMIYVYLNTVYEDEWYSPPLLIQRTLLIAGDLLYRIAYSTHKVPPSPPMKLQKL